MQGSRKPPTGEPLEASKSEGRIERSARPTIRRDDRAEPEDGEGEGSSRRIEVVNVDGPPPAAGSSRSDDSAASGLVSLRRELAKLNQQAAAVEKSLDDQRRDRSEALERLERATERVIHLEAKIAGFETEIATLRKLRAGSLAELQLMQAERDDLARALETAKASTAEISTLHEEVERLGAAKDEATRTATKLETELAELRKRQMAEALKVTDKEAELGKLRPAVERANVEAAEARALAKKAQEEAKDAKDEAEKAKDDLVRAKEDNARDRVTARESIDGIERALEEARATNARLETELAATHANEEALGRQLEAVTISAMEAEARATTTATAHAALEHSVRLLREEIAGAFSRVGYVPSPSPREAEPGAAAPYTGTGTLPAGVTSPFASTDPPSEDTQSSPASRSVPPPPSVVVAAPESAGSIPPPTYASVPPQLHDSGAPGASEPGIAAARRSAFPPAMTQAGLVTREELLAKLVDPAHADEAAVGLKQHPEWLIGAPPPSLLAALASVDYDAESTTFDLARDWEREPLCQALIASLRAEREPRQREHTAWLLKHFAAPSSWKAIADLARSDKDGVQLRRWLLEALDRLAAGRAIGWRELGEVATAIAKHPDASLRDGVVGILVSLDRSDEKRRLLVDILRTDDDEVVLASAVDALASVLPMELDPAVVGRLLGHPSERVKRSVRELIDRARQAK